AYLAPRLGGLPLAMLVTLRPSEAASMPRSLLTLRAEATTIVQPALLSKDAVTAVVRDIVGGTASDKLCGAVWKASGGNPLYVTELLRATKVDDRPLAASELGELLVAGRTEIARRVIARIQGLDAGALGLAQALAVLGDDCELRLAAAIAGVAMSDAICLAA